MMLASSFLAGLKGPLIGAAVWAAYKYFTHGALLSGKGLCRGRISCRRSLSQSRSICQQNSVTAWAWQSSVLAASPAILDPNNHCRS